ncbi:Cell division control protein [Echinococcus granulosus]|uniref:Cell division control protein n=1 Tax=Echinococcus granulosus TaxID=6210 RepID=W6UYM2_ECHGR|nr:Cell division control protein [Echinococcus granulosus]EUB63737.1 Cell division control protein [Echinococcus granulosus]
MSLKLLVWHVNIPGSLLPLFSRCSIMRLRSKVTKLSEDTTEDNSSPTNVLSGHLSCRNVQPSAQTRRSYELSNSECSKEPQSASFALHVNHLEVVVGREKEISILNHLLSPWIDERCSGSLYISGAPGTGKTATVTQVVQRLVDEKKCRCLFLNCMQMTPPRVVYTCILESLGQKPVSKSVSTTANIIAYVETQLTRASRRLPLIVVLDEVDQLASRCQEVFYTVFGWPKSLKDAHLILVGIANVLDLTERLLSGLQARLLRPVHVAFSPYSMDQIVEIISSRLVSASGEVSQPALDDLAVQFCAKKVAASSGDVRIALAICRRALELARLETIAADGADLKVTEGTSVTARTLTPLQQRIMSSPSVRMSLKKKCPLAKGFVAIEEKPVVPLIRHISQAIREVQSDGIVVTSEDARISASGEMPLHHKLVLAACLLLRRLRGLREASVGQVFDVYTYICAQRGSLSPLQMNEFVSVCELLESHGLVHLSVGTHAAAIPTPARKKRLSLLLDAKGVERSLNDDLLISSILSIQTLP